MAGIWETDVYRYYTEPSYARPRKIVDNLELDWLDLRERYYSPEVEFFTKEEILERSGWSEDEVRTLFYDRRFPSCNYGRKEITAYLLDMMRRELQHMHATGRRMESD